MNKRSNVKYKGVFFMEKTYKLTNIDCANCATKMERKVKKIKGVESCTIDFMTQRMILDAPEELMEQIETQAEAEIKKVEPTATMKAR